MTLPASLEEFWHAAIARGLFPLAIGHGTKAPIGAEWNLWSQPVPHPGAGGVGLRCGDRGLTAFDVDNAHPETAQRLLAAFREVLGPNIPVRWGREPRFLIPFYLTDAPVAGRTFTFPDGEKFQLMGGQFVAFGPHKDTGIPYRWENWDSDFPRLTAAQLQQVLAHVPAMAGTSLRFSAEHEVADESELREAIPRDQNEWQAGRDAAVRYLGMLKQELLGRHEGRGSTIFAIVGVLKFAALHGMCTREEIERAITEAGHSLDEGLGGRTLGQEIDRHDQLPVLRGNLIMQAIMSRRTSLQGAQDAMTQPAMALRTGFELSLDDTNEELPWILYQRILRSEVHFFTGHAGAGKSTVITDMALHFLTGRPWLEADIECEGGHILWVAAEDDYGTERRMRWLLRQEADGPALANRFHLVRSMDAMSFEQQCVATCGTMRSMGMRVDILALDTWGASGLCFSDNDTEAVLRAMFTLKQIAQKCQVAVIITDHLPLGNEDAWQKGNGAKSGNSGFMYRVTVGKGDMVSIDCGKVRGTQKAKSYAGRVVSENYGLDRKGRTTTVNVFRRELGKIADVQNEQSAVMRLGALLPGAQQGMDALRNGSVVHFDSVSAELGHFFKAGTPPPYIMTRAAAVHAFGEDGFQSLTESAHVCTVRATNYVGVHAPAGAAPSTSLVGYTFDIPATQSIWSFDRG